MLIIIHQLLSFLFSDFTMKKFKDIRSIFKVKTSSGSSTTANNDIGRSTTDTALTLESNQTPTTSMGILCDGDEVGQNGKEGTSSTTAQRHVDLGSLQTGPSQPRINFPKSQAGDRQRSFSAKYYMFDWLEYSVIEDKVFCFVCRQFLTEVTRDQNEKFVTTGFSKWKKLNEVLKKHNDSLLHIQCTEKYISYKHSMEAGNVLEKIIIQHEEEVIRNRDYLVKLIDIMLCLVRQGLPLRGHRENSLSKNRGNFLEISEVFAKYDTNFLRHLEQHLSYCSPKVQNEIIDIISKLTLNQIVNEVRKCGFFSLMVDEARCYKEEQLSVTIRYVKNLEVEERFLGFLDCSASRDSEGLSKLILEFLDKCELSNMPIIAQSYDGASVMSGKNRGVQAIIRETHPHAVYIHCLAHRVNLVVVDSCAAVSAATAFFNTLQALYVHFCQPGNHASLIRVRDTLGIKNFQEMSSLSTTRWSCRYENCKAVLTNYELIKQVLEEEVNQAQDKNCVEAIGLLSCIQKPEFVVSLYIFHSVLLISNVLCKFFQNKDATLGRATEIITGTITSFEEKRNQFDLLWEEIQKFADEHDISLEPVRVSKKRKQPERMKDYYTDSTLGKSAFLDSSSDTNISDYWKINIYYQIMDNIIGNFKKRFENLPLAESVDSFVKLDSSGSKDFIENYKTVVEIDTILLQAETLVMGNILKNKGLEADLDNLKLCVKPDVTPNLYKLLQ